MDIRFSISNEDLAKKLRKQAKDKGLPYKLYARMILLEHLNAN